MPDPGRIPGAATIPNAIQIRLVWTLANGKTVYNVLHGIVAGGFTPTSTVAEAIRTALTASGGWTTLRPLLNTGVSFAGVDLRDMRTVNQPIVASTGAAIAGTGAGTALPPGDALTVTLRTALVGRGARGRVYLPGFDTTAMAAGGVAAAGTVTAATGFVNAVSTALSGQGITLAIGNPARQAYTGSTGAVHPARSATALAVTSVVTRNNIFDHQRRRAGRS